MGDTVEMVLPGGHICLLDREDYAKFGHIRFGVRKSGTRLKPIFYAVTNSKPRKRLHRLIMEPAKGLVVDHINHNGLDNRRCNLRIATHGQNNAWGRPRENSTGYRGVRPANGNKWQALISTGTSTRYLGVFPTKEDAARAYDAAAVAKYGEFASPNFPEDWV